jgi:hypothetical protein
MGQRRDETDQAAGFAHTHITRGSAGAMVCLIQGEMPSQVRTHFGQRQVLVEARRFDLAEPGQALSSCRNDLMSSRVTEGRPRSR